MNVLLILNSALVPKDFRLLYGRISFGALRLQSSYVIDSILAENQKLYEKVFISQLSELQSELEGYSQDLNVIEIDAKLSLLGVLRHCLKSMNLKQNDTLTVRYASTLTISNELKFDKNEYIVTADMRSSSFEEFATNRDIVGEYRIGDLKKFKTIIENSDNIEHALAEYFSSRQEHLVEAKNVTYIGTLNEFLQTKVKFSEARSFNNVQISGDWLVKKSEEHSKIRAEYHWLDTAKSLYPLNIPSVQNLKNHEPHSEYEIELKFSPTLQDIFTSKGNNTYFSNGIFRKLLKFLELLHNSTVEKKGFTDSLTWKFSKRLDNHEHTYLSLGFSTKQLQTEHCDLMSIVDTIDGVNKYGLCHGDFCFANILYENLYDRFVLIDPRGLDFEGNLTVNGWIYYDIAKLIHSVVGYDKIMVENNWNPIVLETEAKISEICEFFDLSHSQLYALAAHLFITLIPLHTDRPDRTLLFKQVYLHLIGCIKKC